MTPALVLAAAAALSLSPAASPPPPSPPSPGADAVAPASPPQTASPAQPALGAQAAQPAQAAPPVDPAATLAELKDLYAASCGQTGIIYHAYDDLCEGLRHQIHDYEVRVDRDRTAAPPHPAKAASSQSTTAAPSI